VNRKRAQCLMRQMGVTELYPQDNTSRPGKGHGVYPFRLKGLVIERPGQVWAADICYVPMARVYVNVVAIRDWYGRKALAWRGSGWPARCAGWPVRSDVGI
jgi:putative transposase